MSWECSSCEDHLGWIYLEQRTCPKYCRRQDWLGARCQIYQIEIFSLAVYCQRCDILSECYNYRHIGRISGRNSYVLERYCVEQCPTPKCPHREATSVALPILPSPPYAIAYGLVLANGYRKDMVDVQQQGVSTKWKSSGETLKPSCKRNTRIGLRVSKKTRRSSKRLPIDKETGRAGGSRSSTRRCVDDRSIIGLSSKSDVGTRSTSRRCYIGM